MSLFLKIFLWFWLAMALVIGALTFVTWSTQTEPFNFRWQNSVLNAMNLYTETAAQIYENEGEEKAREFLRRIKSSAGVGGVRDVCLVKEKETNSCFGEISGKHAQTVIQKAFAGNAVEFEPFAPDENYAAKKFTTKTGENFVVALQIERPRPPLPLGPDWKTRILRFFAVILTAGLLCYALARYLVSPIVKLREATQKIADGDFQTRVSAKRRDEIGKLAEDFDVMAERVENLVSSQKLLNRDISHELRSPLARLGVALELARTRASEESLPHLERIERESYRLNEMISQILTLSRLEIGAETFARARVNMPKLVKEIVSDANFEAVNQRKQVEVTIDSEECYVYGNERLLQSAIENVVRNALKYTPENSSVEVSLETENEMVKITVRDFGKGVAEEKLKDLFRPFYRAEEARERKSGGVGLGLAITERAVHVHDGQITAQNAPQGGLVVKIHLPRMKS